MQLCFSDSLSQVNPAVRLSPELLKSSRDSLASQAPSREKDLEKFQNLWVFSIFTTHFGDQFMSGSSNHEFAQNGLQLPSILTRKWTF